MAAVDLDLDVQSVVAEQDGTGLGRIAAIADELRRIGKSHRRRRGGEADQPRGAVEPGVGDAVKADHQPAVLHRIASHGCMRAFRERRDLVKEALGPGEHLGAAHRIVAAAAGRSVVLGDHVSAIQCVVEASPARVGGV